MSNKKITLTNESLRRLACPTAKRRLIIYDKKQPKLACVVSKTGIKTFALHAFSRATKKPLQHTIGRYPDISINKARDIANRLLSQLADGIDIKAAARAIREEPTVDDIFKDWLKQAQKDNRTWEESERAYKLHIQPTFGNRKISAVSKAQVRKWRNKLTETPRIRKRNGKTVMLSPATVNRRFALLKAIFNQEASDILNPCIGIKLFSEESRERFLEPDELRLFFEALDADETPVYLRDFINLALLTGARRSNLLSMQWKEIDFTSATWTIPKGKSKNKKIMRIPLIGQAMAILENRKKNRSSVFVFPGSGRTGHLVEPKRAWLKLVKRAGLSDLRFHDLRRTCGSYQAAAGSNQAVISKSLGHQSVSTTSIYTRMNLDPVRKSLEEAAKGYDAALKGTKTFTGISGKTTEEHK